MTRECGEWAPPTDKQDYRAKLYERYASNFQDGAERSIVEASRIQGRAWRWYFRGWLPPGRDTCILDVGCGGGKLLQFYLDAGYTDVHGVDLSPEQVVLARQVTANVTEANALDYLAERPGHFDLISGLDIIEHLHKDEVLSFLELCFAALKPGGRLVLQTPNADSPFGMATRYGDFTHEVCFNPNALARLLVLHGFSEIEVREPGPVPWGYSWASSGRWLIWQVIRAGLKLWNLAETGAASTSVLTRNFLISGIKRQSGAPDNGTVSR